MRVYTVHEPPAIAATREERAESLLFVKDGFSWGALLFGPFYFAARSEWLCLAVYVAGALLVRLVLVLGGAMPGWISLALFAYNVIAAFEANELRRWSLARSGWREIGVTSGRNLDECERRFIAAWMPAEPLFTPRAWRTPTPPARFTAEAAEHWLKGRAAALRQRYAQRT